MLIAGLQAHYTFETLDDIPAMGAFRRRSANRPLGEADYGLCIDMSAESEGFDYVTGFRSPISRTYQPNGSACEFLRRPTPFFPTMAMYQPSEILLVPLARNGCPNLDANLRRPLAESPICLSGMAASSIQTPALAISSCGFRSRQ